MCLTLSNLCHSWSTHGALDRSTNVPVGVAKYKPMNLREMLLASCAIPPIHRYGNFHGLRDFYSLIKTVGSKLNVTPNEISDGVMRNFGGALFNIGGGKTEGSAFMFQRLLDDAMNLYYPPQYQFPRVTDLVVGNLVDPMARHLMLISRGDAATCLLKLPEIKKVLDNPVTMLASPFEDDMGDEHAYLQLSRIILYMEAGRQLIIKGHDDIYGALYDMLNQNYSIVTMGLQVKRNCRIALGGLHNEHCHVHPNFRCIMLEEEKNIATSDPPRLNRCEKQRLEYLDVLDERERALLAPLEKFCREISTFPQHGGALGLSWEDLGSVRPTTGTEFFNVALSEALQRKAEFTHEELQAFGVHDLRHDSFIRSSMPACAGVGVQRQPSGQGGRGSAGTSTGSEGVFADKMRYFIPTGGFSTRDAFCGFNEDTLPSLLVREIYFNKKDMSAQANSEQMLLGACKEALLDMMPSDAVARAKASTFGRNEDNARELATLTARYYTQALYIGSDG